MGNAISFTSWSSLYVYYLETPPTSLAIKQSDFLRYLPDKFQRIWLSHYWIAVNKNLKKFQLGFNAAHSPLLSMVGQIVKLQSNTLFKFKCSESPQFKGCLAYIDMRETPGVLNIWANNLPVIVKWTLCTRCAESGKQFLHNPSLRTNLQTVLRVTHYNDRTPSSAWVGIYLIIRHPCTKLTR